MALLFIQQKRTTLRMTDLEISYYIVGTIAGLVVFFKFLHKIRDYIVEVSNVPIPRLDLEQTI